MKNFLSGIFYGIGGVAMVGLIFIPLGIYRVFEKIIRANKL